MMRPLTPKSVSTASSMRAFSSSASSDSARVSCTCTGSFSRPSAGKLIFAGDQIERGLLARVCGRQRLARFLALDAAFAAFGEARRGDRFGRDVERIAVLVGLVVEFGLVIFLVIVVRLAKREHRAGAAA